MITFCCEFQRKYNNNQDTADHRRAGLRDRSQDVGYKERQDRLLRATEIAASKGSDGVTIEDIMEGCNVSSATAFRMIKDMGCVRKEGYGVFGYVLPVQREQEQEEEGPS